MSRIVTRPSTKAVISKTIISLRFFPRRDALVVKASIRGFGALAATPSHFPAILFPLNSGYLLEGLNVSRSSTLFHCYFYLYTFFTFGLLLLLPISITPGPLPPPVWRWAWLSVQSFSPPIVLASPLSLPSGTPGSHGSRCTALMVQRPPTSLGCECTRLSLRPVTASPSSPRHRCPSLPG